MKLSGPRRSIDHAKRLRAEISLPEVLLWDVLRKKPQGVRFRRQQPAGGYALDFYCVAAQLAVEVDGESHNRGDQPQRDAARDRWLREKGVAVLRIPAAAVLTDLDAVVRHILSEVAAREASASTKQANP